MTNAEILAKQIHDFGTETKDWTEKDILSTLTDFEKRHKI